MFFTDPQLPLNSMFDYHWWNVGHMQCPNRGIPAQKLAQSSLMRIPVSHRTISIPNTVRSDAFGDSRSHSPRNRSAGFGKFRLVSGLVDASVQTSGAVFFLSRQASTTRHSASICSSLKSFQLLHSFLRAHSVIFQ